MVSEVTLVKQRNELDGIVDVIWAAMDGIDPSHQVFYPTFGSSTEARETAISESKERIWNENVGDPASNWIYIRENSSPLSRIIAGCQWRFYTENPFPNGTPQIEASWWPEGIGRDFASEVVRQCYTPRTIWMARPHSGLSLMCVLPSYQRQGIGTMLMKWGINKSDDLKLESFIEATGPGRELYTKLGYSIVKVVEVDMTHARKHKDERWQTLEREKLPIGYTAMFRPTGGQGNARDIEKVWEARFEEVRRSKIQQ